MKCRIWALAAVGTGIAALSVIYSQEIRNVVDPLWSAITANRNPPQMAAGHLSEDDWSDRSNVSRKFTALLEQQFPAGTLESQLRSKLASEGFRSPPPSFRNECQRPIQIEPIGTVSITCSYPANVLRYDWGVGFICRASLHVMWSTEDRVDLTGVHLPPRSHLASPGLWGDITWPACRHRVPTPSRSVSTGSPSRAGDPSELCVSNQTTHAWVPQASSGTKRCGSDCGLTRPFSVIRPIFISHSANSGAGARPSASRIASTS